MMKDINYLLKQLIYASGNTQASIARSLNVTESCISKLLSDKEKGGFEMKKRIFELLGYELELIQEFKVRKKRWK